MTTTFALKSLTYQGKVYQPATAEVDEQARTVDLSYVKESFMKKEKVHLTAVYFDELTKVTVDGEKVGVADVVMGMANGDEASGINEIMKAPYKAALGTLQTLLSGPASKFLSARAEALGALDGLRMDFRKTVLASEGSVPVDSKDPFMDVYTAKMSELEKPLAEALKAFDGFLGISPPRTEKPYAFLYGVCAVQDAKFKGEGLSDATQTLASLGLAAVEDERDSNIGDLTNRLVKLAAGQPQLLF